MKMMTKDERQDIGVEVWRNNKGKGGLNYPTGFGKMYIVINKIIKKMIQKRVESNMPKLIVIIVVDTDALRTEWRQKVYDMLGELYSQVIFLIETIHYFQIKRVKYTADLIVLDEMSKYFSEDRSSIWNGTWVNFKYLIWTDATPKDRHSRDVAFYSNYPQLDYISPKEAEEHGWIVQSKIYNIPVQLNEDEAKQYKKYEDLVDKYYPKLNKNFIKLMGCLQGYTDEEGNSYSSYEACCQFAATKGWHPDYSRFVKTGFPKSYDEEDITYVKKIVEIWSPEKVMNYARWAMAGIKGRLSIIYTAKSKIQVVLDILKLYPDSYCIIFTQRTELCSAICKAINNRYGEIAVEYHSNVESRPLKVDSMGQPTLIGGNDYGIVKSGKTKGEIKIYGKKTILALAVQHIKNKQARIIVAGSALDRGADIPHIDLGITCGFTQNESQAVQRKGRLTRINMEDKHKEATFINLYCADTVEHGFLINAQKQLANPIWLKSINEINNLNSMDHDV